MVVPKEMRCLLHLTGCLKESHFNTPDESTETAVNEIFDSLNSKINEKLDLNFFVRNASGDRCLVSQCFNSVQKLSEEFIDTLKSQVLLGLPLIEVDVAIRFISQISNDDEIKLQAPVLTEKVTPDQTTFHQFEFPIDMLEILSCEAITADKLKQMLITHVEMQRNFQLQFQNGQTGKKSEDVLVPVYPYHFDLSPMQSNKTSSDDKSLYLRIVTEILPVKVKESDQLALKVRENLHEMYGIEKNRPVFRKQNAIKFKPIFSTQLIFDESTTPPPKATATSTVGNYQADSVCETVKGKYAYFHYLQEGMSDSGWGCAYRSLQTVWSWFLLQGYTDKPVITHKEIQQTLHKIGDKPASFVGSSQWIGSFEVSYVLDHHLDITSAFINVQSGDQIVSNAQRIASHFKNHGTPIMVGGGVLAHTICGICYEEDAIESTVKYLILDPHYTGAEELKNIKKKQVYAWKPQSFWKSDSFYNLCLPQKPNIF